jgi:hypothetical protein
MEMAYHEHNLREYELKLYFEDAKLSDLWIPVTWSG